jgi:NitT/TauT family transport system substrate-binding protein
LIGKKILVDHFFQPMAMFKFALKEQGISIDDLEIIDAGSVDEIDQSFRNGLGDYVHQQGPAPQQMEKDGVAHVVASVGKAIGPVAFSSLCATREWCESDMATSFMKAYRKSLNYVIEAPAMDIAKQEFGAGFFPGVDIDVLANTIQAYKDLGCWEYDPVISEESYEKLLNVFLYSGLINKRYPYSQAIVKMDI